MQSFRLFTRFRSLSHYLSPLTSSSRLSFGFWCEGAVRIGPIISKAWCLSHYRMYKRFYLFLWNLHQVFWHTSFFGCRKDYSRLASSMNQMGVTYQKTNCGMGVYEKSVEWLVKKVDGIKETHLLFGVLGYMKILLSLAMCILCHYQSFKLQPFNWKIKNFHVCLSLILIDKKSDRFSRFIGLDNSKFEELQQINLKRSLINFPS